MPTSAIRLRNLTRADIPFAMALKSAAGWNQTEPDWERFLDLEPDGCFLAEYESQPAGTVTALCYERKFGWIAMMLVDPQRRRLGIASVLLKSAVDYLQSRGVETAKLDATPMGKTLYDQFGFHDEFRFERRVRNSPPPPASASCAPILPRDLDRIAEFDAAIFGADRGPLLASLLRNTPGLCFQTDGGFVMGRPGATDTQIGPLVATDRLAAARLLPP